MTTASAQDVPGPPDLIRALQSGFDTVTAQISLTLFPILLDLLLWLGPQIRLQGLVRSSYQQIASQPEMQTPQLAEGLQQIQETVNRLVENVNLLSALRCRPVGIPSLMMIRHSPVGPAGTPPVWQAAPWVVVVFVWVLLALIGLAAGVLYFDGVAQAVQHGKVNWRLCLREWPRKTLTTFWLTLLGISMLMAASFPLSTLLLSMVLTNSGFARTLLFFYVGFLLWVCFHLGFSPHGIFIYRLGMWQSLVRGVRLAQFTYIPTLLFWLCVLVLSQGLDLLWRVPKETSWFLIVGVIGHAFVSTSLLAASFVYYRQANEWIEVRFKRIGQTNFHHEQKDSTS